LTWVKQDDIHKEDKTKTLTCKIFKLGIIAKFEIVCGDMDVARGTEVQEVPSVPQRIFATFNHLKVEIFYE
jgi:hypothetical protein